MKMRNCLFMMMPSWLDHNHIQQRRCSRLNHTTKLHTTNTLFKHQTARSSKRWIMIRGKEMEHYLEYIDNEVWKVIQNGNSKKRVTKGKRELLLLILAVQKIIISTFHGKDDAKRIWAALKTSLEKGYDRFQKLLSQLEALGAGVSDEDANHKFLRSLPPSMGRL
ncbi:hypothetical protein Tco_0365446 [Tanacetum coccineum]